MLYELVSLNNRSGSIRFSATFLTESELFALLAEWPEERLIRSNTTLFFSLI